jgi:PAS domain S-box-containing protein
MLQWIILARSWHVLVRIGLATIVVAAAAVWQLPGEPFLLYFVAVVASASILGRTAGFVAVAQSIIASFLHYDPVHSLKVTHTGDLLVIEIYAIGAALSVEAFCRLVDSALAERSAAISVEARLADSEVQLKLTRNSEARFRATFDTAAVGVAHIGADGRWLRVNGALCRILGYTADELLTKSFQDLTYPDDLAADLVQVELMREGKIDSYNLEKRSGRTARSSGVRRLSAACARAMGQSTILLV